MSKKTAIVLFNLGGPDNLNSVKGFLFNLFYDKAIINLPNPLRWFIAKIISSRRESTAKEIYSEIGGKSPILENTINQAKKLTKHLKNIGDFKVFISMRYSSPRAEEIIEGIENYNPDEIILLPLYPQLSTTTTVSSTDEFLSFYKKNSKIKIVCCYPIQDDYIQSNVKLIKEEIKNLPDNNFKILFTAHGLPKNIITKGDPYQSQVEHTVSSVVKKINIKDLDYITCYQSKVGPLEWIGPSTEDEIIKTSKSGKRIILVPISFVSEHSETLVELDIEYKEIADKYKCPQYKRVDTPSVETNFITALANIVVMASNKNTNTNISYFSFNGGRYCNNKFKKCPCTPHHN